MATQLKTTLSSKTNLGTVKGKVWENGGNGLAVFLKWKFEGQNWFEQGSIILVMILKLVLSKVLLKNERICLKNTIVCLFDG